jgi:hypothetical protein
MRTIIFLLSIMSSSVFAMNVCQFDNTVEFNEAVENGKILQTKKSTKHDRFTDVEKKMIHAAMRGGTIAESVHWFGDYYGDETETGSNAGQIVYYKMGKEEVVLVHFWPGDNEVGAFVKTVNGKVKVIAEIGDGDIDCK